MTYKILCACIVLIKKNFFNLLVEGKGERKREINMDVRETH